MKICTLIVRLVGIALLVRSVITLIELRSMSGAMQAKFGGASLSISGINAGGQITRMHVYVILGILAGLVCAAFAPFVARLLTFDAPAEKAAEPYTAPSSGPATQPGTSNPKEGLPSAR